MHSFIQLKDHLSQAYNLALNAGDEVRKKQMDLDDQKKAAKKAQDRIDSLEADLKKMTSEDGYTVVKVGGMGTIAFSVMGSLDIKYAIEDCIKDLIEKYTGTRPHIL